MNIPISEKYLNLGDWCWNSGDEEYPYNMECSVRNIVDCLSDRYKVNERNECVLRDYDFVTHGSLCNEGYSNCFPSLLCLAQPKQCLCPHTNQRWDSSLQRCVTRQLGDTCTFDHDCDDRSTTQTRSSGRICLNGRCSCDASYNKTTALQNLYNSLEIVPPACGQQGEATTKSCANCPLGNPYSQTCGKNIFFMFFLRNVCILFSSLARCK